MAELQNLTDMNIVGVDVFNAPLNGPQSYLGSFNSAGKYTGIPYSNNLAPQPSAWQSATTAINNAWNGLFGSAPAGANPVATVPVGPAGSAASASGTPSTGPSGAIAASQQTPLSSGGTTNPGQSDTSSASIPGTIQNYFTRAIVVVVGFIFLAVGLHMLAPSVVPDIRRAV